MSSKLNREEKDKRKSIKQKTMFNELNGEEEVEEKKHKITFLLK